MTTKMTYSDALNNALTLIDAISGTEFANALSNVDETKERLIALREQIAKRNTSHSDKPTKAQTENVGVKETILTTLEFIGSPATITDVQSKNEELFALSNQKVSALMRQLVEEGKVTKTTEKRKSYFQVSAQ